MELILLRKFSEMHRRGQRGSAIQACLSPDRISSFDHLLSYLRHSEHLPIVLEIQDTYWILTLKQLVTVNPLRTSVPFLAVIILASELQQSWICFYNLPTLSYSKYFFGFTQICVSKIAKLKTLNNAVCPLSLNTGSVQFNSVQSLSHV